MVCASIVGRSYAIGIIFSILDLSDYYYCYSQNHIKDWFDYDEHIHLLRNSRESRRAVNIQDEEIHGNDVTSPSILINETTAPASEQKQEITPVEQLHPEAENSKPNEVKSQEQFNSQGGARGWVKNSGKVAFFAITGLVMAVPTLVAVPVLGASGFTSLGSAAGSIAAGAQAAGGAAAAGGLFATLQSAAMGGYGVAAVIGVIQGTAALGAGSRLYHGKVSKKKELEIGLSCVNMRM